MSNKESKHDNIRQHLKDYEKKTKSDENLGEENKNVKTEKKYDEGCNEVNEEELRSPDVVKKKCRRRCLLSSLLFA